MHSLQILDDKQLSNAILRAIKFNLEKDFMIFLKNEAVRRLMYSAHDDVSKKNLQDALDVLMFKRELELLHHEHLRCKDQTIRNHISSEISFIESVIDLATQNAK